DRAAGPGRPPSAVYRLRRSRDNGLLSYFRKRFKNVRPDLVRNQLELPDGPVDRVEDHVPDAAHRLDFFADALGNLLRTANQIVRLPELEVLARNLRELRDRRLGFLAFLEHVHE